MLLARRVISTRLPKDTLLLLIKFQHLRAALYAGILNRFLVCSRDDQTQVPSESSCSSAVTAADTRLTSLTQSGLTQQPDAALSCEQHAVPDDVNIEPSPSGSLDSVGSATGLSLAHKQKAGSAGVDSSSASAGSAAACSTTELHSAAADMALIGSAASAQHPLCKSAQQSAFFAPVILPNRPAFPRGGRAPNLEQFAMAPNRPAFPRGGRAPNLEQFAMAPNQPAFPRGGRAPHLDQFATAPQASPLHSCWLYYTVWQRGFSWY